MATSSLLRHTNHHPHFQLTHSGKQTEEGNKKRNLFLEIQRLLFSDGVADIVFVHLEYPLSFGELHTCVGVLYASVLCYYAV